MTHAAAIHRLSSCWNRIPDMIETPALTMRNPVVQRATTLAADSTLKLLNRSRTMILSLSSIS